MAIALADIYCWIKTIAQDTGKSLPDGYVFLVPQNVAANVIVRYSVANDSHACRAFHRRGSFISERG